MNYREWRNGEIIRLCGDGSLQCLHFHPKPIFLIVKGSEDLKNKGKILLTNRIKELLE